MGFQKLKDGRKIFFLSPGLAIFCNWNLLSDIYFCFCRTARCEENNCGFHATRSVSTCSFVKYSKLFIWIWEKIKIEKVFHLKVHSIKPNGIKCRKCRFKWHAWEFRCGKKQLRIFSYFTNFWIKKVRKEFEVGHKKRLALIIKFFFT